MTEGSDRLVKMQSQVEQENDYIVNKLSKQLQDAYLEKDALIHKLEEEKAHNDHLMTRIKEEEKLFLKMVQDRFQQVVNQEKLKLSTRMEQEEEYATNAFTQMLRELSLQKW